MNFKRRLRVGPLTYAAARAPIIVSCIFMILIVTSVKLAPVGASSTSQPAIVLGDFLKGAHMGLPLWGVDRDQFFQQYEPGVLEHAATRLKYVQVDLQWLNSNNAKKGAPYATDDDLRHVIDFSNRNRIPIALEVSGKCGGGGEVMKAWLPPMQRLKELGAHVGLIDLDHPFFKLLFDHGKNPCYDNPPEVIARSMAEAVKAYRELFPSVIILDTEGIEEHTVHPGALAEWFDSYKKVNGSYPDGMENDVAYTRAATYWPEASKKLEKVCHDRGMLYAMVYRGDGNQDDRLWGETAWDRAVTYEQKNGGHPDIAMFVSWLAVPHKVLPESDPFTLTGLVNQYARMHNLP